MLGLGLSVADLTVRRRSAVVAVPATSIVIEGDSITSTTPNQSTNQGDFFSYVWKNANAGLTVSVNAQASRTVGGASYNGDGADGGSPSGNTLLLNRPSDIAVAPQLLTALIGANDLGTFATATYIQRLIDWAGPLRAAGVKIAYSAPLPYNSTNQIATYANFTSRRASLYGASNVRSPAVWGQWADIYMPIGEHPDFADTAQHAALYADGVHPSGPVSNTATGQYRMSVQYNAIMRAITDVTRTASTTMFGDVWPASETNLSPATVITRRFIVSGVAHAGLASGISVSGGGAQVRLNGAAYGSSIGRIYNGDVIDLQITTSVSSSTAVSADLTIGSETRTLSYTTVAMVTPATYAHEGVSYVSGSSSTHTFTSLSFANTGIAVLAIKGSGAAPTGVSVGGVAATRLVTQTGNGFLSLWTVTIAATGSRNVVLSYASARNASALSWGVVRNADAAVQQISPSADGAAPTNESQPHLTASLTVPSSGIAIAFYGEYGGASVTPATANSGTTFVGEGNGTYLGETQGVALGTKTASGTASFNFAFGTYPRAAVVFKAAGT